MITLAVVCFHKRVRTLYESRWIHKCLESVFHQSYQAFDLIELNYNDVEEVSLESEYGDRVKLKDWPGQWLSLHEPCSDHSVAMNLCFDYAKTTPSSTGHTYEAVANVNLDDFYDLRRFEMQMAEIGRGADLVSSFFSYINDAETVYRRIEPAVADDTELRSTMKTLNIFAHPVMMLSTRVWRLHADCCYFPELPCEDWKLWQRMLAYPDVRAVILPHHLLMYRVHPRQISAGSRKK